MLFDLSKCRLNNLFFFFGFDTWERKIDTAIQVQYYFFAKCKDAPMCLKKIKLLVTIASFQANLDSIIKHGRAEVLWRDETQNQQDLLIWVIKYWMMMNSWKTFAGSGKLPGKIKTIMY